MDTTLNKLIFDISRKGYKIIFSFIVNEGNKFIKIEAQPTAMGLGCSLTINHEANIFDALKAIEKRLFY